MKLLEAVLKTGNRMNVGTYRGGAQAIKLDTLLKLSDVKGTDGKTTLLHFVVQEIIRSEGIRAVRQARENKSDSGVRSVDDASSPQSSNSSERYRTLGLEVVSGLSTELQDVKKAAVLDADVITTTVSKLNQSLAKTKDFLNKDIQNGEEDMEEESDFGRKVTGFVEQAQADIAFISTEEKRIMALIKSTGDYFHGNTGKDEGLRLFAIVRDFLVMVDKVCKEVKDEAIKNSKAQKRDASVRTSSLESRQSSLESRQSSLESRQSSLENTQAATDIRQKLFPAIAGQRLQYSSSSSSSSSDDES